MKPELAHSFLQKTLELVQKIEIAFLSLGERLYKIRSEELWKNGYSSYQEFLMETRLSEATASKIETVFCHFIADLGVAPEKVAQVGWSDAYLIAGVAETKKEAIEWLDKGLSSQDLRIEIMGIKKGIDQKDCSHSDTYKIEVCRTCGMKTKIIDET